MVGSSLPVSFINPVYIRSSLLIESTASNTVFKVLMAEDVYLEKLGVCEAVTDDEEVEQEEPAESEEKDECDE